MKQLFSVLGLAAILTITACSSIKSDTATSTAADLAALVVVEGAFRDAKIVLHGQLDQMPIETGLALLELETEADALVVEFRAAWDQPIQLLAVESLMERASTVYQEGKELIAPHLQSLTLAEQQRLRRLDVSWARVDTAFERWRADPDSQERRQMVTAGLELATALLLVL